jgi:NitT/TauT family transport system permease protein
MTEAGDFHRSTLAVVIMCIFVTLLNRFFWRKLYLLAEDRSR